ncbi:hypothetical protein [Leptolyngbya sp. FACHB-17]|uniref:hypothetical protein n=1 Tax=unclassified Leptolyngbya TaxID=2650499 RepID=UPI0018EFD726|nr:hypothetical protein [Leptolyngbya sp. FACHB-17]
MDLKQLNNRLKSAKIGVTVRCRGDRLSLRATLPPKPGGTDWKQQDIALGIYASPAGLKYGLRNHELFYIDLEKLKESPVLSIVDHEDGSSAKTGERRVWAVYPEWWDKWQLWNVSRLPQVSGKNNRKLGHRVTAAFRRSGFRNPYNLRHRWAVRTIEFGLPVELAAQQMGHSYKEHTNTYHYWITDEVHQRAYDLLMQRDDRPLPP